MRQLRSRGLPTAALAVTALVALAAPSGAAEASPSAFAAKISVEVAGAPANNVGPLAYADKTKPEASVDKVSIPNVLNAGRSSSKIAVDTTTGAQTVTATLADLHAGMRRPTTTGLTIATVTTTCTAAAGGTPEGKVEVSGARFGSTKLPANPAPNTSLDIPGSVPGGPAIGKLVLNEQIKNADGTLTVNAAHFTTDRGPFGTTDAVLASATCGNAASPEPPAPPAKRGAKRGAKA